jgi:eukaryotic-like serine/threonine-protein kinase
MRNAAESPPLPGPEAGEVVQGRYTLARRIAEGGMATVWAGRDELLGVPVAIKFMHAELLRRSAYVDQMVDEARAAAALRHPAIVRMYDVGFRGEGTPFLVMELLDGQSLGETLENHGRLSPQKAVRCLLPIASALGHAHSHDIIHRDVKPENIILTLDEHGRTQPKLIDFGVASAVSQTAGRGLGAIVGTPVYIAPEQANGDRVGPPADVWSLCVVLYEAVAGKIPFDSDTIMGLLHAINDQPPASLVKAGLADPELWAIVERGLAKDPTVRWQSMQSLGEALAAWLKAHGVDSDLTGMPLDESWAPRSLRRANPLDSMPPPAPVSDVWTQLVREVQSQSNRPVRRLNSDAPSSVDSDNFAAADAALSALDRARAAIEASGFEEAYRLVREAIDLGKRGTAAAEVLARDGVVVEQALTSRLGGLRTTIEVAAPPPEAAMSTRDRLLASLVDGRTVLDALDVSGTDCFSTLLWLCDLADRGILSVRRQRR